MFFPRRCVIGERTAASEEAGRLEAGRKLAIECARMAAATRCHNVTVLEVANLSPVTDFFVIASGTSPRQMRTVTDDLEELAAGMGYKALSRSGYDSDSWVLIDLIDVIVHIFSDGARQYYDLDHLWGDARRVEWQAPG